MNKSKAAIAALVMTAIIWGTTFVALKIVLREVPPFSLAFLRFALATLIISPIFLFNEVRHPVHSKDLLRLFLLGIVGVTLHLGLLISGINNTTATNAAVISALAPLGVAFAAGIFLKEKITANYYHGSMLAFFGVLVIFGTGFFSNASVFSETQQLGNLLIGGSIITWAIFNIGSKELFKKYSSFTITSFLFLTGMVTFAPLALWEYQANPGWTAQLSSSSLWGILYISLFSSVIAYLLYEWGLEQVKASVAGLINYLTPVVAVFSAVLILGETLTLPFLIGAMLTLAGLILATYNSSHHIRHPHHKL